MFRKSLIGRRYIMEEEERKTPEQEAPARDVVDSILDKINSTDNPQKAFALFRYLAYHALTKDATASKNSKS